MSRNIDFSKPLTEDEQAYVNDRPWLLEDARLSGIIPVGEDDFRVQDDDDDEAHEEGQGLSQDDSEDADEDNSDSDEDADDEDDEDDDEDDSEEIDLADLDYSELKEEAKRLGLSAAGSKEQLIKRIQEADAE